MGSTLDSPQKRESHSREIAAILAAARAVLENRAFSEAARLVLGRCKSVLRAEAGLVALARTGGAGFDLALVDSGSRDLEAAGRWPAALDELNARAVREGRPAFANDLSAREAKPSAGTDPPALVSGLVAPILVAGEVAALVGLVNKPGGFSEVDCELAEIFGELAAVALLNSRTVNGLERDRNALEHDVREGAAQLHRAEEEFRTLVENLPDIVARFDPELRHLYVSPAIESLSGRPARDYVGRTNRELGGPAELVEAWEAALRAIFASGQPGRLEFVFPTANGDRYFDCRLVPEHDSEGAIHSVLTVAHDVTDRWLAHEAERHARDVADALREATVALTRSLDRETVLTTLLDRLRTMVPFDRGSVMLLEGPSRVSVRVVFEGDRAVPLASDVTSRLELKDHPVVREILDTGTAVLVRDVRERSDWSLPLDRASDASWMGVPLHARGTVAGLLALSKREPGYFNNEHVKLAEAMSSQASVAVENAVLYEQMQASALRMRALSRRLVEVQESERRSIARELHDEAGQALTSLRFGLRLLERRIDEGASVTGTVAELMERTDAVIDGLHRLAVDLRPVSLDHLGLEAALRQYARSAASKFGLTVRFKAIGFDRERLPATVETALYRVVQEAITNVVRHARASRADILLEHHGASVRVMIEDDGVGFDSVAAGRKVTSVGLLGMRERAEALGGTLLIESEPGSGTTIVAEVPSVDSHPDR